VIRKTTLRSGFHSGDDIENGTDGDTPPQPSAQTPTTHQGA